MKSSQPSYNLARERKKIYGWKQNICIDVLNDKFQIIKQSVSAMGDKWELEMSQRLSEGVSWDGPWVVVDKIFGKARSMGSKRDENKVVCE